MKRSEMIELMWKYEINPDNKNTKSLRDYLSGMLKIIEEAGMLPPKQKLTPVDYIEINGQITTLNNTRNAHSWEDEE